MARRKARRKKRKVAIKKKDTGNVFLGVLFLLIAAYLFISQSSLEAKWFGGGIMAILGLLFLIPACKKK